MVVMANQVMIVLFGHIRGDQGKRIPYNSQRKWAKVMAIRRGSTSDQEYYPSLIGIRPMSTQHFDIRSPESLWCKEPIM